MSLGQWLNAKVGQPDQVSAPATAQPAPASLASSGQDIAEIHRRLDSITQQINQLSPGRASAPTTDDIEAESPDHPWPVSGGPKATHLGARGRIAATVRRSAMREPVS